MNRDSVKLSGFVLAIVLTLMSVVDPASAGVTKFSLHYGPTIPAGGFFPECAYGYGRSTPDANLLNHSSESTYSSGGTCNVQLTRPANWTGTRVIRLRMAGANSSILLGVCGTWSTWFYNNNGQDRVTAGVASGGCGAGFYALGGNHCYGYDNNVTCSRWSDANTQWLTATPNPSFTS